jgi:hypothetical protein
LIAYLQFRHGEATVTATGDPHAEPEELKVTENPLTDQAEGKILFDQRQCCGLVYMVTLDNDQTLLLTVWDTGTSMSARVVQVKGSSARMVFDKPCYNDWPQAIAGRAIVLVHQGRRMTGNLITPTRTELWQWNGQKEEFELKATVPYERRYAELARLLDRQ